MQFMQLDFKFFQNQFLIATRSICQLTNWNQILIGQYFFYLHPTLKTAFAKNSKSQLVIIGDTFNPHHPTKSNQEIAYELNNKYEFFKTLVKSEDVFSLGGTYLIFHYCEKDNSLSVLGDTSMQRELYYLKQGNKTIALGATDKLISKFFPVKEKENPLFKEFYKSDAFKKRKAFILDDTNYECLYRLKPNFYLNINTGENVRFFPCEKIKPTSLTEASQKSSKIIANFIKAANHRYKVMIPVSAGWDSRLLLAASRSLKNEIVYYVLQTHIKGSRHFDIKTPRKLMAKLNLPIEIIDYSKNINSQEIEIVKNSISFYREKNLEYIINYFYKKHPGKLTLNGNISEIVRLEFDEVFNLTPKKIAFIQKYPSLKYVENEYEKWYKKNKSLFLKMGYRTLDMLYWEENCANWVAKSKTEFRAYGIEVFSPFNSRELILTLYGLPKKYRRKQNPVVYKKMIEILWPEVLQIPVNPGLKKIAMRITQYLGIFPIFRNLKLWWNLFKGRKSW
jgi:hypothetical protein